ncbi:hypothetical protein GCM10009738_85830 [Kitasatospora viridis]
MGCSLSAPEPGADTMVEWDVRARAVGGMDLLSGGWLLAVGQNWEPVTCARDGVGFAPDRGAVRRAGQGAASGSRPGVRRRGGGEAAPQRQGGWWSPVAGAAGGDRQLGLGSEVVGAGGRLMRRGSAGGTGFLSHRLAVGLWPVAGVGAARTGWRVGVSGTVARHSGRTKQQVADQGWAL